MFKVYFGIVILSLSIVCLQHVVRVIHYMGYHVNINNHFPGPCQLVPGVDQGSEDMETLPDGRTFITSGFVWSIASSNFQKYYEEKNREGRILFFDFKAPDKGVTILKFDKRFDQSTFHPHGISVLQNEDTGKITLFVVNHHPGFDRIEKFEFVEDKMMLQHMMSYADKAMRTVNDVAATSEHSFYFTNYIYTRDPFGFMVEIIMFLPFGNVVYFDGTSYEVVAERLVTPNGVTVSRDGRNVYVAHEALETVNIYNREANNSLTLQQEIAVNTKPDNILIELTTGNLIIGAHPAIHLVEAYMDNPTLTSPSQVLIINMVNGSYAESITELYSEDGSVHSASTVASIYNNKMLVGSIFTTLLYCEVRYMPTEKEKLSIF